MQQTKTYKFNIIDTSDTFSPDALNANAETAERELTALADAHAADKAALEKTAADNKAALQAADTAQKAELLTAIGSGGKTCRIAYGSYKGTGRSITVDFRPMVVFLAYVNGTYERYGTILLREDGRGFTNINASYQATFGENTVTWTDSNGLHTASTTVYYVVIGESPE